MMKKIRLKIAGVTSNQSRAGSYAVVLKEAGGKRRLPIVIGGIEAQAIAMVLEKIKPSRPMTHDLFRNFALKFKVNIQEIIINRFSEGVYYALLVCEHDGNIIKVDSRSSDAIALALRVPCPIYTYENVMKENSFVLEEDKTETKTTRQPEPSDILDENDFTGYSLDELKNLLKESVLQEEYEKASLIRDEIKRRNEEIS
ncbi:MAG: bifunctional nuclease family protein [Bacteroidales bacterium]|nr:bifunctional nuclease family protein [Bacteroidales bacterium]